MRLDASTITSLGSTSYFRPTPGRFYQGLFQNNIGSVIIKLMVKFGGRFLKTEAGTNTSETGANAHIGSNGGLQSIRMVSIVRRLSSRRVFACALILVLVIGGAVFWFHQKYIASNALTSKKPLMTESQAFKDNLKKLQDSPPGKGSTDAEKAAYYQQLMQAKQDTNDPKGATAAFQQLQSLPGVTVKYDTDFYAAQDYCALGDKASANQALDDLEKALPKQSNFETAYNPDDVRHNVEVLRQGCGI
jgi:hypothetical protein